MPTWATLVGIAVGILLIGIAAGLYFGNRADNPYATVTAKIATAVSIRFQADNAINLSAKNIRRWYFLKNSVVINSADLKTKLPKQQTVNIWNLIIVFEKPVALHQLVVSGGPSLPPHEVRMADPIYAIIVFNGDLNDKTVTIEAILD